jgi:methylated-DNA-[protein]-cysteine S-methyltransferase
MATEERFHTHRPTPFGRLTVVWTHDGERPEIIRVLVPQDSPFEGKQGVGLRYETVAGICRPIDQIVEMMTRFLQGEETLFVLEWVRMDGYSPFQRSVLLAEYGIPRGWVSTYQRIAGTLGFEMGARALGSALAHNPFPLIIPCHRAMRSDGTLGGF